LISTNVDVKLLHVRDVHGLDARCRSLVYLNAPSGADLTSSEKSQGDHAVGR